MCCEFCGQRCVCQSGNTAAFWAAQYNTWLLIKLTLKGIVFSFLFFSFLLFSFLFFSFLFFSFLFFSFDTAALLQLQLLSAGGLRIACKKASQPNAF